MYKKDTITKKIQTSKKDYNDFTLEFYITDSPKKREQLMPLIISSLRELLSWEHKLYSGDYVGYKAEHGDSKANVIRVNFRDRVRGQNNEQK